MASSLFGSSPSPTSNNGLVGMLKQFNEFKRSINGQDPRIIIDNLLRSGKMSGQQLSELTNAAKELSNILK